MIYNKEIFKTEVEINGKMLSIETGRYARQANGAVMVRYGDTMVFVSAVMAGKPKEDSDFFPLQVEYREKASAAGKIPGGFLKREGRPSDKEILSARQIDRPIRPLFPSGFKNETQVIAFIYSYDNENDPDVLGAIGASAALHISDIPFSEPVAEVRVGRIDGKFIVNPTMAEVEKSDIELVVAGTESSIMMVEGESKEVSESVMLEAIRVAHEEIKKLVKIQIELRALCGKPKKEFIEKVINQDLYNDVVAFASDKISEIVATVLGKEERVIKNNEILAETITHFSEKYPENEKNIGEILHDLDKDIMRKRILEVGLRLDGRNTKQIRPITVELGLLPRVHGSALFTRGETQALMSLTLGTSRDTQLIDGLNEGYEKSFILHYNFPPFSVGETGRISGVGRREVGHGNLAERSLKNMIPSQDDFPYTIRLISDVLESNGSSSMATVCSGSLALMDAGAPVKDAVAGIAMGLIKEGDKFAVLSDILGNEDHLGDMDFKVAGTKNGITAFQMDIKIQGLSYEIFESALQQAKEGRMHILNIMNEAIQSPRAEISKYAPCIERLQIQTDQIGALIGPGGKVIQGLQKRFGTEISIDDNGNITIAGQNTEIVKSCTAHIQLMFKMPEVGEIYEGFITKIVDFGAFVEFMPFKEGLLHISQIDNARVDKVSDFLKEGEKVTVKLLKIENGKYQLSRKALLERTVTENQNLSTDK